MRHLRIASRVAGVRRSGSLYENLVAFWNMDEASGVRYNAINPNTYALTDNNTVASVAGRTGLAASFLDSNSESLSILNASAGDLKMSGTSATSPAFTVSFWYRFAAFPSTNSTFMGVYNATGNQRGWVLVYAPASDNTSLVICRDGTSGTAVTLAALTNNTNNLNTWYHMIFRVNQGATVAELMRGSGGADGPEYSGVNYSTATEGTGGIHASTADFMIGAQGTAASPAAFHTGYIDSVGIWKKWLTNDEIYLLGQGWKVPY